MQMSLPELRKVVTYDEDILSDGGRACSPVLRVIGVAAVVTNPWHGRGFVEDLQPEIRRMAPVLGKLLTDRLIVLAGSGDAIEAYGKAALCGWSTARRLSTLCALVTSIARLWVPRRTSVSPTGAGQRIPRSRYR